MIHGAWCEPLSLDVVSRLNVRLHNVQHGIDASRGENGMTRLLVSVRSAEEAADAVSAGADLIDVKEPSAGSLGAATPEVVAAVMEAVAGRRPDEHCPRRIERRGSPIGRRMPSDCRRSVCRNSSNSDWPAAATRPGMPRRWRGGAWPHCPPPWRRWPCSMPIGRPPARPREIWCCDTPSGCIAAHCWSTHSTNAARDCWGFGRRPHWHVAWRWLASAGLLVVLGGQITAEQFRPAFAIGARFYRRSRGRLPRRSVGAIGPRTRRGSPCAGCDSPRLPSPRRLRGHV